MATAVDGRTTCHGADSFAVSDGLITAQTIDYEVNARRDGSPAR